MKKLLSLVLCVSMLLTLMLGTTVFAAVSDSSRGTITVNDLGEDASVTAYQIIQAKYKGGHFAGYEYVPAVKSWMTANGYTTAQAADINELGEATKADMKTFYNKLATSSILTNLTKGTADETNGTATISGLPLGQYIVLATGGQYMYSVFTADIKAELDDSDQYQVANAVVNDTKKSQFTIEKTVEGEDEVTAALNEVLSYEIMADVPQYPVNRKNSTYTISDTLPAGVDYVEGSLVISGVKGEVTTVIYDSTYNINLFNLTNLISQKSISIDLADKYDQIKDYTDIKVTYDVKVNTSAVVGVQSEESNNINEAKLKFANNPLVSNTSTTIKEDANFYTFGLFVTKIDGDTAEEEEPTALEGAIFKLQKYNEDTEQYEDTDRGKFTTGAEGTFTVDQLKDGKYLLVELQAPDGYNVPLEDYPFTIEADRNAENELIYSGTINESGTGTHAVTIQNFKTVLPTTGGQGTMIFTIVGVSLMLGVIAFVVIRKRMISTAR